MSAALLAQFDRDQSESLPSRIRFTVLVDNPLLPVVVVDTGAHTQHLAAARASTLTTAWCVVLSSGADHAFLTAADAQTLRALPTGKFCQTRLGNGVTEAHPKVMIRLWAPKYNGQYLSPPSPHLKARVLPACVVAGSDVSVVGVDLAVEFGFARLNLKPSSPPLSTLWSLVPDEP